MNIVVHFIHISTARNCSDSNLSEFAWYSRPGGWKRMLQPLWLHLFYLSLTTIIITLTNVNYFFWHTL